MVVSLSRKELVSTNPLKAKYEMIRHLVLIVSVMLVGGLHNGNAHANGPERADAPRADVKPAIVKIPSNQPVLFWRKLKALDVALADLRPSETRVVQLSLRSGKGKNIFFFGRVDIVSGTLTVVTKDGSMEFYPAGKPEPIEIKLPSGIVQKDFNEPLCKVRIMMNNANKPVDVLSGTGVGIGLFSGKKPNRYSAGFSLHHAVPEQESDLGNPLDVEITGHDLPFEVKGGDLIATFKVVTSTDFKGTLGDWVMPAPK